MYVLQSEYKILRKVARRPVSYNKLSKKYPVRSIDKLIHNKYLSMDDCFQDEPVDPYGFASNDSAMISIPDTCIVRIAPLGIEEIDRRKWFGIEFLVKSLIIPIIISVVTTLITLFLTGRLSLFQ